MSGHCRSSAVATGAGLSTGDNLLQPPESRAAWGSSSLEATASSPVRLSIVPLPLTQAPPPGQLGPHHQQHHQLHLHHLHHPLHQHQHHQHHPPGYTCCRADCHGCAQRQSPLCDVPPLHISPRPEEQLKPVWSRAIHNPDKNDLRLSRPFETSSGFAPGYLDPQVLEDDDEHGLNDNSFDHYEYAGTALEAEHIKNEGPLSYHFLGDEMVKKAPTRSSSIRSFATQTSSSACSTLSPVQTELTWSDPRPPFGKSSRCPSPFIIPDISPAGARLDDIRNHEETKDARGADCTLVVNRTIPFLCLGKQCQRSFHSHADLEAHMKAEHTHTCNWAGCHHPSFSAHDRLVWHVKAEHLLVCPVPGCTETAFQGSRMVKHHLVVAHREVGFDDSSVKDWKLKQPHSPLPQPELGGHATVTITKETSHTGDNETPKDKDSLLVNAAKRKCRQQLWNVVEKKARKACGSTPKSAESPTDLVRSRASRAFEVASFPLVYEHAVLPFLAEFMPKWSGPHHVISVTRGRTPQSRRICIMTRTKISRARKIIIAGHVMDLLTDNHRRAVSFVFSIGQVERITWARGLSRGQPDDICAPRNPYYHSDPVMGDSIGIRGNGVYEDSTATLGPCLSIGGGSYWLGNFHPFVEAYQCSESVEVEHPSHQDRTHCLEEGHDAMSTVQEDDFKLGRLEVASGLNLKTTRISHDQYWEDCAKEPPLIVTDWALITTRHPVQANILRRFPPSEARLHPIEVPIIKSVSTGVVPSSIVVSSGRTSGYQSAQVCEIPAYVSGDDNGTQKATREWFVEELQGNDEEAWIRGGIGVEGDSGAAIVDAESGELVGQLWGRNRYWGPGPRQTFFTPIADIFDDIQEKCGQQFRPRLPHEPQDSAARYPTYPTCRICYDLRVYLDSRRSSRMSLQSMIMWRGGDGDQDLTSNEGVSELNTPRDGQRLQGAEETASPAQDGIGPSHLAAFYVNTPFISDMATPSYAPVIDAEDLYDVQPAKPSVAESSRKRTAGLAVGSRTTDSGKRTRTY